MKRTTLADIAEKAGASMTTVSFVLREKPNGYGNITVGQELREKIKALAKEMNYVPHRSARALRTGKSHTIGILSAHSDHPLNFAKTYRICEGILQRDYDYIVQEIDYGHEERLGKALGLLWDYAVDGIVLVNTPISHESRVQLARLEKSGLPVVEVAGMSQTTFPCVAPDYHSAAFEMASHLVAGGHNNLFVITAKDITKSTISERIEGIFEACVETCKVNVQTFFDSKHMTYGDIEVGYESTRELLSSHMPDAIFYANDFMAFGGLQALRDKGLTVPDDVAVCGFDGLELTRFSNPPITTAIQPIEEMATMAVGILFDMLEGKESLVGGIHRVPCQVIFRASTGPISVLTTRT